MTTGVLVQIRPSEPYPVLPDPDETPCESDPESMFPDHKSWASANTKESTEDRAYIRDRVCGRCPIMGECLRAAVVRGDTFGIAGGFDMKWERGEARKAAARYGTALPPLDGLAKRPA